MNTTGGTPTILLTLNTGPVNASYQSGSGTSVLVFRYTVAAGNNDNNGISLGSSINLNGGTIKDAAGNDAVLTLNGVGSTVAVWVDAVAPTVTSVSSVTTDGTYKIGDVIAITVSFDELVTVTGTPQLQLETGSVDRIVNYSSGTGTNALTFNYTVQAGDESTNLDYISSDALSLNMGTIKDAAGNNVVLTLPVPGSAGSLSANKTIVIDGQAPSATVALDDNNLIVGETATVTVTFTEAVAGFTNGYLTVPNGTLDPVSSADGNITFTGTFTPTAGVEDITNAIILDLTGVTDAAGNTGSGTASSANFTIDTKVPAVILVSSTAADGLYKLGETMTIRVTFDEAVTVTGLPQMELETGPVDRSVAYISGSGTNTLSFNYITRAGDETADLDYTSVNALSLNAGTIKDAAGNDAALTLPVPESANSLGGSKDIVIQAFPTASLSADPLIIAENGGSSMITATLSQASSQDATVELSFSGTANHPNDYTRSATSITINAGSTTGSTTITGVDDAVNDNHETVIIDITGGTKCTENGTQQVTVTIAQAAMLPGAPTGVMATAGNGRATVTFTPPADDGGSPITGYIVTSVPGNITATGTTTTITITGLSNGTEYTFTVKAVTAFGSGPDSAPSNAVTPRRSSSGGSGSGGGGSTPSTPPTSGSGVNILVNGSAETAATASTQQVGRQTVTTVTVDDSKIEQKLNAEGNHAIVTIPFNTQADVVIGVLNGQTIKSMERREAVLEIRTTAVTYTLPASQINIDAVAAQFGHQVELRDVKVSVRIAEPPADTVKIVQDTANQNNYQIVVQPVQFEITCTSGDKTVPVSRFNRYVQRTIAIPDGVDPSRITTAVVLNTDGTFSHVPTSIVVVNGKYYAQINSLTNSTYSVIWNHREFTDAENHWAKEAVNDMGARLVISGVGNNLFEPDRDITRAEFAAIVVRALGLKSGLGTNPFHDVANNA